MMSLSPALIIVLVAVAWLTAGGMAVRSVSRIWLRHWAEQRLSGGGAAIVARVVGFAILVIVFGQILPRAIARRWPAALAPFLLPVLGGFELISRPHAAFGRMI